MTIADFYILNASDHGSRLDFLGRLVEKAAGLGHKIHIHIDNQKQAAEIDDYLWTYKIESFLPHTIKTADAIESPITIGFDQRCDSQHDLLINLASELPPFYDQFKRIAEIVVQHPPTLDALRAHYRQLQSEGIEARIHDFRKR